MEAEVTADEFRGYLLQGDIELLCKAAQGTDRILEVGSFIGLSAISMALANPLAIVVCVDTWVGPESCRAPGLFDEFIAAVTRAGVRDKIFPIVSDSSTAAQLFPDGWFDLLYIDGDHTHDGCLADLKAWWPKGTGRLLLHDCVPDMGVEAAAADYFNGRPVNMVLHVPHCHYMLEVTAG